MWKKYRLCGKKGESVQRLLSGCEKLAQKEYKRRHDSIAKKVHWDLCKESGLEHTKKWYEHVPEGAIENEEVKVLRYQCSVWQCERGKKTRHNFNWQERAKGDDHRYCCTSWCKSRRKRKGESRKVKGLKEIGRLWKLKMVEIVPVVIGAHGCVTKEFD